MIVAMLLCGASLAFSSPTCVPHWHFFGYQDTLPQAASDGASSGSEASSGNEPAAIVDEHPISKARVERQLRLSLGKEEMPEALKQRLWVEARNHLVKRHLVLQSITSTGTKIGEGPVAFEISKLTDRLKEVDQTLEGHLGKIKSTRAELEYEFHWQLMWGKYLDKHLSDKNLKKFYERNQRQFDGTEVQLAHVLLPADSQSLATEIRESITSGKSSWEAAVEKHSIAKSSVAQQGLSLIHI